MSVTRSLAADIERRCRDHPAALVVDGDLPLTGAQFLDLARELAAGLGELGVAPGTRVAIDLPPSADLLVAVAATWLAGASFVPVDLTDAPERAARVLAAAAPTAVLTASPGPLGEGGVTRAVIEAGLLVSADIAAATGERSRWPDEAYVIFTSGSTGAPKGVSVGHGAIGGYVRESRRHYRVPDEGVLFPAHLPVTFDAVLTSLLLPLFTGNVAVPITDPVSATFGLADFLADVRSPVLVKTTPGQVRLLADLLDPATVDRLDATFVIGGEQLHYQDVASLRCGRGITLFNEYGPTEASVGCAVHAIGPDDPDQGPVAIGRPHERARFTVDPPGADTGELLIGGACLANGYVGEADTGAFTDFGGEPVYRTGDRVRRDPSGRYHFLGRADDQVKVNGFRVEPAEIEAALRLAAPGSQVAVLLSAEAITGVVTRTDGLDVAAVAAELRRLLPAYLRPAEIRVVPEIPLTRHGKVDLARLARPV